MTRQMPSGTRQEPPRATIGDSYVSHCGQWDMLLTRVGQRLWLKYKIALQLCDSGEAVVLLAACESVWDAKREYRGAK